VEKRPIIYRGEEDRQYRIKRAKKCNLMTVVSDEDLYSFAELLLEQSRQGYHILDYMSKEYTFTIYIRNFQEVFKALCKISCDSNRHFHYKLRKIKKGNT